MQGYVNFVDLEKCWKMSICLHTLASILTKIVTSTVWLETPTISRLFVNSSTLWLSYSMIGGPNNFRYFSPSFIRRKRTWLSKRVSSLSTSCLRKAAVPWRCSNRVTIECRRSCARIERFMVNWSTIFFVKIEARSRLYQLRFLRPKYYFQHFSAFFKPFTFFPLHHSRFLWFFKTFAPFLRNQIQNPKKIVEQFTEITVNLPVCAYWMECLQPRRAGRFQ